MTLYLVCHGRPVVDPGRSVDEWELDPAGFDDVWALRGSGRLPTDARWFCSPEPKAVATAQLLTDKDVGVLDALREQERNGWVDEFHAAVWRAFDDPDRAVIDGWEPLSRTRDRVVGTVTALLAEHPGEDLVLVGHGTAWTLLAAALTGSAPDPARWESLGMPDVIEVDPVVESS